MSGMKSTAIIYSAQNRVELKTFHPREIQDGEILIETAYTCVSPGTELRRLSSLEESYPLIPGYAIAGRVIQTRSAIPEGTKVFCAGSIDAAISPNGGGHLSHAIANALAVTPIPDGVSLKEASTCILGAIALRGLRMSRPRLGETAAAIGLEVIGQFSARLHVLAGARVIGCDMSSKRVELLKSCGIEAHVLDQDLSNTFAPHIGDGVELIIDSTGAPSVMKQAIMLAKLVPLTDAAQPENRYLIQGSYGGDVTFNYHHAFRRQITFLVPKAHQPQDRAAILEFYRQKKLSALDLVSEIRQPEDAPRTYQELRDPQTSLMTVVFAWNGLTEESVTK